VVEHRPGEGHHRDRVEVVGLHLAQVVEQGARHDQVQVDRGPPGDLGRREGPGPLRHRDGVLQQAVGVGVMVGRGGGQVPQPPGGLAGVDPPDEGGQVRPEGAHQSLVAGLQPIQGNRRAADVAGGGILLLVQQAQAGQVDLVFPVELDHLALDAQGPAHQAGDRRRLQTGGDRRRPGAAGAVVPARVGPDLGLQGALLVHHRRVPVDPAVLVAFRLKPQRHENALEGGAALESADLPGPQQPFPLGQFGRLLRVPRRRTPDPKEPRRGPHLRVSF